MKKTYDTEEEGRIAAVFTDPKFSKTTYKLAAVSSGKLPLSAL